METNDLRALVKQAALAMPGARLWGNGLGFDCRGTSYHYSERIHCWTATRRTVGEVYRYGEGATPLEAKRAAGIGGRSVNSRGGVAP